MRATLLVVVALVAAVVAGCGSSGSTENQVTVPSDVHDLYGEVEAILGQMPYQDWYRECVVGRVKKEVGAAEAEALAELPESKRATKAMEAVAAAGPACERSTSRPTIDPNATEKEFALYRASLVTGLGELAEREKLSSDQVTCVEEATEELPVTKLVALGNGSHKVRERILVTIIASCAGLD
ncbi:MAG: hypothetical protein QM729_13305 [Solirubrobacterales bacterium]